MTYELRTDARTAARMRRQRRRDTRPELDLRRLLHAAGFRFRVNFRVNDLPRRTVDVAFIRAKVAVFVDGCFWHACPDHATWPQANSEWWREKLQGNNSRDRETDRQLVTWVGASSHGTHRPPAH